MLRAWFSALLAATLGAVAGCGPAAHDGAGAGPGDAGVAPRSIASAGHPALRGLTGARARAARIRAVQTNPGPGYAVRMFGNAAHFAQLTLELHGAPAVSSERARGNRVELERGPGLTEWYASGPLGLEQGFSVAAPSEGGGIALDIAVTGARVVQAGEREVALVGARGDVLARYGEAYAADARGRALPVRLEARLGGVTLDVDARGATYPVAIDPLLWTEKQKLVPWDGTASEFGGAVAIDGTTALVGAGLAQIGSVLNQGSAYVYVRSGDTWGNQQKLLAPDGAYNARFGIAVALSGDTAIIGADHDVNGSAQGSAYIFVRNGTTWTQQQKLYDAAGSSFDRFARAVAIQGDTALVGAPDAGFSGAAYVYTRTGTTWTLQQKLTNPTAYALGFSVALSGDTAVLGATSADSTVGAVYVFVRSGTTWTEQQKLVASDGVSGDYFGGAVAVDGDTAIGATDLSSSYQGAAYVFVRNGTSWTEQQKLVGSNGAAGDDFGRNVALVGDRALIGADSHAVGAYPDQGAAYAFVRSGTTWTEQQTLATAQSASYQFGWAVGLSGTTALIGAPGFGTAHVFELVGAPCSTGNECSFCVDGTCCSDLCSTPCRSCVTGTCSTPVTDQDDDNCTGAHTCDSAGACRLKVGQACSAAADCASDFCADGVCCNTACDGACDVCSQAAGANQDGQCTLSPAGSPGAPDCSPYLCNGTSAVCAGGCSSDAGCAAGAYCAADGTCKATLAQGAACDTAAGQDCLVAGCRACATPGGCVDGYCCDTACDGACDTCDATPGTCTIQPASAPGAPACEPYLCSGSTSGCATSCAGNADCGAKAFCSAGACVGTKTRGESCTNDAACASDHCADSVCCDTACGGQCEACNLQGASGTCTPVVGAPRGARAACPKGGPDTPCASAACDGTERTSCADFADSTVTCAVASCENGVAKLAAHCDGAGQCAQPQSVDCGAYACDATTCKTTCNGDGDCAGDRHCDQTSHQCVASSKCTDATTSLDPAGNSTSCSPYVCADGICKTACTSSGDCIAGYLCDPALSTCTPQASAPSADTGGCSCRMTGMPVRRGIPGGAAWLVGLAALLSGRRRRRK